MRSSERKRKRALDSDEADGRPQPIKVREKLQQQHLLREEVAKEVERQVQEKVTEEVERQVQKKVAEEVERQVQEKVAEEVERLVQEKVAKEVERQVQKKVAKEVERQVQEKVAEEVERQVQKKVAEEVERQVQEKPAKQVAEGVEHQVQEKVGVEVECALAKIDSTRLGRRSFPEQIRAPNGRNFQLCFKTEVSQPLYTCEKIGGQQGAAIDVVLLDANIGQIVKSGPESSLKLNVVPLKGDFNVEDSWTPKDFEDNVVQPREGKCPVLTGDLQVKLKDGVGKLGNVKFTDNSSRQANRRFRLGLKVASDYCEGIRIREAKTEAFIVLDQRGESYKKHFPPSWDDDVWRLVEIARGGEYCKRLNDAQINTVGDLLQFWATNHKGLEDKLKGMPKKKLNNLIEHAKTCIPRGKDYLYSRQGAENNVGGAYKNEGGGSTVYAIEGSTHPTARAPSGSDTFRFAEGIAETSRKIAKPWFKFKTAFRFSAFVKKEADQRFWREMIRELLSECG